ncbi:MAG: GNAT family N-acetyltransferase [Desulfobacteraceae bacterium]|nr:GNAT family N-acetyltransferase [Desulfobacteraceae bacterium]
MQPHPQPDWLSRLVPVDEVLSRIRPGMSIFLGTGVAEPRTLVRRLMASEDNNLKDLELVQIASHGSDISLDALRAHKCRLKTFFPGWVSREALSEGLVDLIPSRYSQIRRVIASGQVPIEVAFVQITPPNELGYSSLGVAVDVAREAMAKADLVVGEINPQVPFTLGDTIVSVADFDLLVEAADPPVYFEHWPVDPIMEKVAANIAALIEDGDCLTFSIGSLFEALSRQLDGKRDLGLHSPFFTDAQMDLVKKGIVTNRRKAGFRGKSLTSYAVGTAALMQWLNRNPIVEFQRIDSVCDPVQIGRNPNFFGIFHVRKVDLSGLIALHEGSTRVAVGPGETIDFVVGAEISPGGRSVCGLPSRNREGRPNILLSIKDYPSQLNLRESVNMVATEYGVAPLKWRSLRERAQALIEIAHPDDREGLFREAKAARILYPDQIFLKESAHLYPSEIAVRHTFKDGLDVRFRAIKPSDEGEMRRLFYRFSERAVYYRYFAPVKSMPHARMQAYVNVDYRKILSIVGLIGDPEEEQIIAEGRFIQEPATGFAEVAFVVDERFQGHGIATFLYRMLLRLARERGVRGFTAEILASNKAMLRIMEKESRTMEARLFQGVYALKAPFDDEAPPT